MKRLPESFAQYFRRHGRDLTESDLRRILEEEFGIEPDAQGRYWRHQFEPFWMQIGRPR